MKHVRCIVIASLLLICFYGRCFSADVTGRAFMGSTAGTLIFIGDDYMAGSALDSGRKIRLYADIVLGYVFKPNIAGYTTLGFGWQAYTFDNMRVSTTKPITVGVEYRHGIRKYVPRVGAGIGYYLWSVLEDRKVIKDPITREELKRGDPGAYVAAGLDYFARPNFVLCWEAVGHYILSEDKDAFPVGYALNDQVLVMKMGIKYYFRPKKGF